MFGIIDTDNNGVISAQEYEVFFQIVGFDQKLVPEAFQAIDTDKDRTISRKEFAEAYVEYCKSTDESHPSCHMFGHIMLNTGFSRTHAILTEFFWYQ